MPGSPDTRPVVALGLCAAVLLVVVAAPWMIDPRDHVAAGWRADVIGGAVAPALPPVLEPPPLDRLAAIVERPLFARARRPATSEPPPDAAEPPPGVPAEYLIPGVYALSGLVVTPKRRLVLLKRTDTGATVRVVEGQVIDGWTVIEVAPDKLLLEADGRRQEIIVRQKARPKKSLP